jgi:hypothetical protein
MVGPTVSEGSEVKITPTLRKEVNAAVRTHTKGAAPLAEVGLRGDDQWLPNALKWASDSDLCDMRRFADLREIDDDAANPGCAELDLYVTTGIGPYRELETNVCILIRAGHVVGATSSGHKIDALKTSLGFPFGPWDNPAPIHVPGTPAAIAFAAEKGGAQ